MSKDLISIIVPVYNVEMYLEKSIDSILKQTYIDLEVILIDDGSTDESGAICDKYADKDSRIIVIHQKNQGQSVARNVGIEKHVGKYLMFVDSDDMIEKKMVEVLYYTIKKTGLLLAAAPKRYVKTLCNIKDSLRKEYHYCCCSGIDFIWSNLDGLGFAPWGKLYHSCLWEKNLFFPHIKYEDTYLIPRKLLSIEKMVWVLDGPCYLHHVREGSTTYISRMVEINPDLGKVAWTSLYYFKQKYGSESEIFQKMLLVWFKMCLYYIFISNKAGYQFMRYYRSIIMKYYGDLISNQYCKYEKFRLLIWTPFFNVKICKLFLNYQIISEVSEQVKNDYFKEIKREKRILNL